MNEFEKWQEGLEDDEKLEVFTLSFFKLLTLNPSLLTLRL